MCAVLFIALLSSLSHVYPSNIDTPIAVYFLLTSFSDAEPVTLLNYSKHKIISLNFHLHILYE